MYIYSPTGLKYSKAVEWQMPVANVTWLSDLLLGETAALRLPLQERYTTFDPNTDPFKLDTQRSAFFLMSESCCKYMSVVVTTCYFFSEDMTLCASDGWRLPVKVSKEAWKVSIECWNNYYTSESSMLSTPQLINYNSGT